MSIALLAIGDGRHDYHARSLASALEHLPKFDQYVWVNDETHDLGFAGAIQHGWDQIETDWVFHLELDFVFHAPVPVDRMIRLLLLQPHLAQIALKRQAVNAPELAVGGVIEANPDAFTEHMESYAPRGCVWTEHRAFFTTNPSVYHSWIRERGWPQQALSEGIFTHRLLADPSLRFAYWGGKFDPPLVTHIGAGRAGKGY